MTYSNNNYNDDQNDTNNSTEETNQEQTTDTSNPGYVVIGDEIGEGDSVSFMTIEDLARGDWIDSDPANDEQLQEIIDRLPDDFEAGTLGVFELYYCLPTNDNGELITNDDGSIEGFDKDELVEAQIKASMPGVGQRSDTGWKLGEDGLPVKDKDGNDTFEGGGYVNDGTQLQKNYCVNYPFESGWDYVDYETVSNLKGPLGSGVIPLVTVPFGPPVTYGNRSHNPARSERAYHKNYIRKQGNPIQWNHILPDGEGIQDNIEKNTTWESGMTKTETSAKSNDDVSTQPYVYSFSGGSRGGRPGLTVHNGVEVRFGKHQNKLSDGKKTTHNNVLLGHENKKGAASTYDFGVVGTSCFIYPHRGNTNANPDQYQYGHAYWYVQNVYGVYRFDSTDEELTERKELYELITEYLDGFGISLLPDRSVGSRSANGDTSAQLFSELYSKGVFERAKKVSIPSNRNGHLYLQTFMDLLNVFDERNKGLPDHEHVRYHSYDWISEHLTQRKKITVVDLFSYIFTSLIGVPREALDILGRTIDIESLGKFDVEKLSSIQNDRLNKDRFILWAYVAMKAKDITLVPESKGDIRIITSQDKSITFNEFLNWNSWGFVSACERNGGLFTSDSNEDMDGRTFKRYHWCVEEDSYAEDPEFPVHILDPLLLDSKVYIGEDTGYIDLADLDTQFSLSNGRSADPDDPWADIEEIRNMTKYSEVKAVGSTIKRFKSEVDATVKTMNFTFQPNEMDKYYEWYNPIQRDANGEELPYRDDNGNVIASNLRADLAPLGAKPAIDIFHSDRPDGTAGSWKFVLTIEPGQRRIYRPNAGKANFNNRRYFKAQTVCPKRVEGNFDTKSCTAYTKNWSRDYKKTPSLAGKGYTVKLNITPATKRGADEIIAEETQGPTYFADDRLTGWPEPDWYSTYWEMPLQPMRIKGVTGKMELLTPGETYEVKVAYETGQLISQHKVYPEFHAWWGRDRECLNPNDATNPSTLFTPGSLMIPQDQEVIDVIYEDKPTKDFKWYRFKAESEYLFFAGTKTGRTLEEWSPEGEQWMYIRKAVASDESGPAYYADSKNNNFVDISNPKWQEPLNYYEDNGITLRGGFKYTIKPNTNTPSDYKLMFAGTTRALSPKSSGIKTEGMFAGGAWFGVDKILRKNNYTGITIYAPSSYLVLAASNNSNNANGPRDLSNWSDEGEPVLLSGGAASDLIQITEDISGRNVVGTARYAKYVGGSTDLNAGNKYPRYLINDGQIDFNNGYWTPSLNDIHTIYEDIDGDPIDIGEAYKITITEKNNYKYRGTYYINWVQNRPGESSSILLDPQIDDQSKYSNYYQVTDQAFSDGDSYVVEAKGFRFCIGMSDAVNYDHDLGQYAWSPYGQPIDVVVEKSSALKGPGLYARSDHDKSPGEPDWTDIKWDSPFNAFKQPGVRFEQGQTYDVRFKLGADNKPLTDYTITFWWMSDEGLFSDAAAAVSRTASIDIKTKQPVRFTHRAGDPPVQRITCMGKNLILGLLGDNVTDFDNFPSGGVPVELEFTLVEEDEELDVIKGPAYFSEASKNFIPEWKDEVWNEPLQTLRYFNDSNGTLQRFEKGRKYKFTAPANTLTGDLKFFFPLSDKALSPKSVTDPTYDHEKDFVALETTLNKGSQPKTVEFYLPGDQIIFGSSNNDQIDGEDRTIDDWSSYGEPTGVNGMGDNDESNDIIIEDTTPSTPTGQRVSGIAYHANHQGGRLNINAHNDNLAVNNIESGQIDFFSDHWLKPINVKNKTDLSTDDNSPSDNGPSFEKGKYYSIKVTEKTGWETGGEFIINWLRDEDSETLSADGSGSRTVLYENNYEADLENVLQNGEAVTVKAKGTRLCIGVRNYTKPDYVVDPYNVYMWDPYGQPIDITAVEVPVEKGPVYFADATSVTKKGTIKFTSDHWERPMNYYQEPGFQVNRNQNYRITYQKAGGNAPITQSEYSFYFVDQNTLDNNNGQRDQAQYPSTKNPVILNNTKHPDGVVIKATHPYLVMGGMDGTANTIEEWPANGRASFIEITPTDDPVTDEEADDKQLEGPGYFADNNTDILPDIGNVHYYNPITTETKYGDDGTDNGLRMRAGNKYIVKATGDLRSDVKILFLMDDKAREPRRYGITRANMLSDGMFTDVGAVIRKGSNDTVEFFAPSGEFILGTNNSDPIDIDGTSTARSLANWSERGEPTGFINDDPESDAPDNTGIIMEEVPREDDTGAEGPAYWANVATNYTSEGQSPLYNNHWATPINYISMVDDGTNISKDKLYTIRIDGVPGITAKYTINWIIDDQGINPSGSIDTTKYNNVYTTQKKDGQILKISDGETVKITAQSNKFYIGVCNITGGIDAELRGTEYCWNPLGRKINYSIVEDINTGPAYLGNNQGIIDTTNAHWSKPFNHYNPVGFTVEAGKGYKINPITDENGDPIYDGLRYHFVWCDEQFQTTGTGNSVVDSDNDGVIAYVSQKPNQGNAYAEITCPEDQGNVKYKRLIIAAFDPAEPNKPITDWSKYGAEVPFRIFMRAEDIDTDGGHFYYGSPNENNTKTDFQDPYWEKLYHYNISPSNMPTQANPNPQLFEKNKYYRVKSEQAADTLDSVLYGALTEGGLILGDNHAGNQLLELGRLEGSDGPIDYVDLKNLQYNDIVFTSRNTPLTIQKTDWNPKGQDYKVNIEDRSDLVKKDNLGNYVSGIVYFGGDSTAVKASLNHIQDTDHFCLPLNYYKVPTYKLNDGTDSLASGIVVELMPSAKGRYMVAFAKNLEALQKPQLSNATDWVLIDRVLSNENEDLYDDQIKLKPEGPYVIVLQYRTPGINNVEQWSIDGDIGVRVYEDDEIDFDYGPSYWAEDNPEHRPYINHDYWKKPIHKWTTPELSKGYKYTIDSTSTDGSEGHIHKIWYGAYNETDRNKLVTNDEIIRDGETDVEIIPRSSYVYLGTYNTGVPKLRRWPENGRNVYFEITSKRRNVPEEGPGYWGSNGQITTWPDFSASNNHWQQIYHWNIAPQNQKQYNPDPVFFEKGGSYRIKTVPGQGETATQHDYEIYGGRTDDSLTIKKGSNNGSDLKSYGKLKKTEAWIDILDIDYEKIIFSAYNEPQSSQMTDWNPSGIPVNIEVEFLDIKKELDDNGNETNKLMKGPAYYASNTTPNKPEFDNEHWVSPLNYQPNIQKDKMYEVKADATMKGRLSIFFASSEEALVVPNAFSTRFTNSGVSVGPGETVKVRAVTEYMIFGQYGVTGSSLESWNRDGEPVEITIKEAPPSPISGPAYWADEGVKHKPDFTNDYWDKPLTSYPTTLIKDERYEIFGDQGMPDGIRYQVWFGPKATANNPTEATRYVTSDTYNFKKTDFLEITALDEVMFFGAYNTGKDSIYEWSERGEPVDIRLKHIKPVVVEGPEYWTEWDYNSYPDFTDGYWTQVTSYNDSQALTNFNYPKIEKGNYYRITTNSLVKYDLGIFGLKSAQASMIGDRHSPDFMWYEELTREKGYIDIRNIPYPELIFSAYNVPNTMSQTDWSPLGEQTKISIQKIEVEKDNKGLYITGPSYYMRSGANDPEWKNKHYVSPLNYISVEKGKQYDIFFPGIYTGTLKVFFVKTRDGLSPQTNNITDIVSANTFIDPNETKRVSATSNFMVFGHYNKTGKNSINDWGRDGEPVGVTVTEYAPSPDVKGPLYMCEYGTEEPDFRWEHWNKPLNVYDRRKYSKGKFYRVRAKNKQDIRDFDVSFIFSDSNDCQDPGPSTTYYEDNDLLKYSNNDEGVIIKIWNKNMFLGACNVSYSHSSGNNLYNWSPYGEPLELEFEEVIYPKGPEYWAETNPAGWPRGLPDFTDPHWDPPTYFVDGISKNKEYEVRTPRGELAQVDYYIWETTNTNQVTAKPSDFTLLGEISKGSSESVGIAPTTNNVVIGVRRTGLDIDDWSPKGEPTDLIFEKLATGRRGISYYGDKATFGSNAVTNGREIDWTNEKWRRPGSSNFLTQTKGGALSPNREYKFTLNKSAPKYVYSIWTVTTTGAVAADDHPGHPSAHTNYERNITRNKKEAAVNNKCKFYPNHGRVLLCAFKFNGQNRTLANWSSNGEPVSLRIVPTDETLTPDIPLGPILSTIRDVITYLGILVGIIWSLIGLFKPEFYLVNFNEEGPYNEVKDNHYPCIHNNTSMFLNRYADFKSRAIIRLCEMRYAGTMINFKNSKGGFWAGTEKNFFHNVGICSMAPTYAQSVTHLGNPILIGNTLQSTGVRQVAFQFSYDKDEDHHSRKSGESKKLLTEKNEISEQPHWDNNDQWFCVSNAVFSKTSKEANSYFAKFKDSDGDFKTYKEYQAKSHEDSMKDKNIDGCAHDVSYDGDKRLINSPYTENIFNDKGHLGYVYTKGYKGSADKYRHYHFHIGVESFPPNINRPSGINHPRGWVFNPNGMITWPLRPEDGNDFYVGLEMDLSEPNLDAGGGDFQFTYIRLHFGDLNEDKYVTEGLSGVHYAEEPARRETVPVGRIVDLYPTSDTNYLLRGSGEPGPNQNDFTFQLTNKNKHCKFMSKQKIKPSMYLTDISYGVHLGTVNAKTYYYAHKMSNLRPLMSSTKVEVYDSIHMYNRNKDRYGWE